MAQHKVILGVLDKLKIEHPDNITEARAKKKLERFLSKNGLPKKGKWSDKERELLNSLAGDSDESEGEEEAEETENKSSKKKGDKKAKGKKKKSDGPPKAPKGGKMLMVKLIKSKASDKKIEKIFMKRYAKTGQDKEFVLRRIAFYKRRANRIINGGSKVKNKDKKGDKKSGKKAKTAEKNTAKPKKGKKAKASDEEE